MRTRTSFIIVFFAFLAVFMTPLGKYFFPPAGPSFEPVPRTASDFEHLSRRLSDQESFSEAEMAAKSALALDPKMYKAWMSLGRAYYETGNYIKALRAFHRAEEFIGNDPVNREIIYRDLGLAYAAERKEKPAWRNLRKAYAMKSVFAQPTYWSSRLLKAVADDDYARFKQEIARASLTHGLEMTAAAWDRSLEDEEYARVLDRARAYLADNPGTVHGFEAISRITQALDGLNRHAESQAAAADAERKASDPRSRQEFASLRARSLLSQKKYQDALDVLSGLDTLMVEPKGQKVVTLMVSAIIQESQAQVDLCGWLASPMPEEHKHGIQLFMAEQLLRRGKVRPASDQITVLVALVEAEDRLREEAAAQEAARQKQADTRKTRDAEDARRHRTSQAPAGEQKPKPAQAAPAEDDSNARDARRAAFVSRMYYLASGIYEADGDISRAKEMMVRAIKASPDGPRGLPARIAYLRLMQLDIKTGTYESAFRNMRSSGFFSVLSLAELFVSFAEAALFVLLFGWFSRRFFRRKWEAVRASGIFRLKDLGMFMFVMSVLGSQLFFPVMAWNYYSGGKIVALHLDPILVSGKLMQLALIFIAVYVLHRQYRLAYPEIGFVSRGFKVNVLVPLAVFLVPVAVGTLMSMLYMRSGTQVQDSIVQNLSRNIMLQKNNTFDVYFLFMSLAVLTPIAEEIVFRAFLFRFLEKYTNAFWGVCLSAVMFAAAHEQTLMFPYFLTIGIILAVVLHKTKSIVPCFVLHAMYNSVAFFAFFFG